MELQIDQGVTIDAAACEVTAIRSRGPGGQHVNTAATGIQLRFDVAGSSLPASWRARLLASGDGRLTDDGVIVIRSDRHRSQEQNRREAFERLRTFLASGARAPKPRRPTKPSRAAKRRRLDSKRRRGAVKALRSRIDD